MLARLRRLGARAHVALRVSGRFALKALPLLVILVCGYFGLMAAIAPCAP